MKGHQRYKCKGCGCQFTDTKPRGVDPILKKLAVVLYAHCGVFMLGIAKLFNVSAVAVLKWIRKYADQIEENTQIHKAEPVQIDEVWHFVNGKKNKVLVWRAIEGLSRQALGFVLGDRTDKTLKKLVQKSDNKICTFVTDDWEGYYRILPENRHVTGKDLTYPIEQINSDIRHRLARFKRKTKASSRSLDMVKKSLKLFRFFQDNLENVTTFMKLYYHC